MKSSIAVLLALASALLPPAASAAPADVGIVDAASWAKCGVVRDTVCWTIRLGCNLLSELAPAVYQKLNDTSGCPTGRPDVSTAGSADAGALLLANCGNYGVVVVAAPLGTSFYCAGGACQNEGVVVLVGKSESCYGSARALVLCVGDLLDDPCVDV